MYINASLAPEGNVAATTTSILLTRRSITWHMYINAAMSFCIPVRLEGVSTSSNVVIGMYHTLKCLADIRKAAAGAYSFKQTSFSKTVFVQTEHNIFFTTSPFGDISLDQFSMQGRIYDVIKDGFIQHKRPTWIWSIHARPVHAINLTITRFQLMYSGEDCSADHMTVSEPDRVIGHYCGNKQPWSVESCSNRVEINMGLVSPGHVAVQILYQVIDKPPTKCQSIPFSHSAARSGIFIIGQPTHLDSGLLHKYSISWYIIVDRLKSIDLKVHHYPFVMVYHGRFAKSRLRAYPHSVQQGLARYEIVGFHAIVLMEFLVSSTQNIHIEYHVKNNYYTSSTTHCRYSVTTSNSGKTVHFDANPNNADDTRNVPLYCLVDLKTHKSLRIEIERIQFSSNGSEDCLDSGLIIYDEHQEDLEIFQPQIGPLCGEEMERSLQFTPQRVINTLGYNDVFPREFEQTKALIKKVYIAFYSYAENEGLFRASITQDLKCVGFFQPCVYLGARIEGSKMMRIAIPQSYFGFRADGEKQTLGIDVFVEVQVEGCLMLQLFPVPNKHVIGCSIHIESITKESKNNPRSFLEPVTTDLYYSTGSAIQCPGCYDRVVLVSVPHSSVETLLGEQHKVFNGSITFFYFPHSVTAPIAARFVIEKRLFIGGVLESNIPTYIGSEAATLDVPWTAGFYRLTFQRRIFTFYGHKNLCFSPKCLLIQRPILASESCPFNLVVSYFKDDIPYHTWHLNKEYQSLTWLSKPETLFTIGIDFEVTGINSGCSIANISRSVNLYFLHLTNHFLSEGEQVYNAGQRNCKVKVDDCRFGKCYNFHHPMLHRQSTWNKQKASCRLVNKTLPKIRDMEDSNWLRSLIYIKDQHYVPRYMLVFLDLYKQQVGSFAILWYIYTNYNYYAQTESKINLH